jgi:hypothetical protein
LTPHAATIKDALAVHCMHYSFAKGIGVRAIAFFHAD